jgi:polyphosphate kinase 2 (PPK2 family)
LPLSDQNNHFWSQRYADINGFEQHLVRNGTIILKFYLQISKEEQKKRLLKRLDEPDKYWKFSFSDLAERSKWSQYVEAYEEMLNYTSAGYAPWYIIPSDKKWVTHQLILETMTAKIQRLNLKYSQIDGLQKKN